MTTTRATLLSAPDIDQIRAAAAAEQCGYPPWCDNGQPTRNGLPTLERYNEWQRDYLEAVGRERR